MLLIIAPASFGGDVAQLQEHKRQTGMPSVFVTLEAALQYGGEDDAESIKRCIESFYERADLRYVMLVGDSDILPVRYTMTDRHDENNRAHNVAFYPTDLYYSCLYNSDGTFATWKSPGQTYYGRLFGETHSGKVNRDDVNIEPVVAVGRIPASTEAEFSVYVKKVIAYERSRTGASWGRTVTLAATDDWDPKACNTFESLRTTVLSEFKTNTLYSQKSPCPADKTLTAAAFSVEINAGREVVAYIGHGNSSTLAFPGDYWNTTNVAQLVNSVFPVILSAGCDTADFAPLAPYRAYIDVDGNSHIGTEAGEEFLVDPPQPAVLQASKDPDTDLARALTVGTSAGAVAYAGGVTGMQLSDPLEELLREYPAHGILGDSWRVGITSYYGTHAFPTNVPAGDWFEVARFHQEWKFLLFGDPSLRVLGSLPSDWSQQLLTAKDRGTSSAPALTNRNGIVLMCWKGVAGDPRIFYSIFDGAIWSEQRLTSGDRGTSAAPALTTMTDGRVLMAWKGKDQDVRIFYSRFDGTSWSEQWLTSGDRGTSAGPALTATIDRRLIMAWKGKGDDGRIFYSYKHEI
jgi:hypothetical protein